MIEKHSTAVWTGSLKEGGGKLTSQSGALADVAYSHATRFADQKGANPEELVAAAHASCFAMFLSALMTGAGVAPKSIEARATVKMDPTTEGSPTVMASHLDVTVDAPADKSAIREFAEKAKAVCPISKLLKAEITMDLTVA